MELLCPHCLKKVTVADDKAGQVLNCPLCQGVFAAPALPAAPMRTAPPPPSPPPVSEPSPFAVQPLEPLPPPTTHVTAEPLRPAPRPAPPPPRPPADYSRTFAFRLRPDVLVCSAPVCLFVIIFVLSFFDWHGRGGMNLWQLGFGSEGTGLFIAYILLTILTFLLAVACAVLELGAGRLPTPPQLAMLLPWKSGIPFLLLALTFLLFAYDYQEGLFAGAVATNPVMILLPEKVAFRLHLVALIATGLELWVQSRIARALPLPRFSMKL